MKNSIVQMFLHHFINIIHILSEGGAGEPMDSSQDHEDAVSVLPILQTRQAGDQTASQEATGSVDLVSSDPDISDSDSETE